jgi:hypothetical protein
MFRRLAKTPTPLGYEIFAIDERCTLESAEATWSSISSFVLDNQKIVKLCSGFTIRGLHSLNLLLECSQTGDTRGYRRVGRRFIKCIVIGNRVR